MTDDLRCVGSNHVPGHTPDCPRFAAPSTAIRHEWTEDTLADTLEAAMPDVDDILAGFVSAVTSVTRELSVTLVVAVTRAGRRRCPICRRIRVLIRQTAFAADQPVGYGEARCYQCAGLRNGR